jgi:coenzyme F420-reducing hydrogenase alpha subunit
VSDLAGQLDIELHSTGAAPGAVIRSSRPLTAARIFAGKPLAAVSSQLPLLFSVCGTAQAMACAVACEAALGWSPAPSVVHARGLLLRAETIKEHLWRLLLDWPKALIRLDAMPAVVHMTTSAREREAAMAAAMRAFLQLRAALTAGADPFLPGAPVNQPPTDVLENASAILALTAVEQVFGTVPADWLAGVTTAADLDAWATRADTAAAALVRMVAEQGLADLGRCDVGTLPAGSGGALAPGLLEGLAAALAADAFVAAPLLDGQPMETTPFARELHRGGLVAGLAAVHGNGLLPRLAALLVELARDSAALAAAPLDAPLDAPVGAPAVAALAPVSGTAMVAGIGAAPAARGLLVHRLELLRGAAPETTRVLGYRMLAPTEWNFHPEGVVAKGLADIAAAGPADAGRPDRIGARARMLITAVDPCVDYRLSVS